jgi:ATP-dependent helicase HrpA
VCIRLYDEEDLARRPAHTDPEILRSSLAGVILRMKSLGLGAVEEFPFLDAPQPRMIADGYQLLAELGAVDQDRELTGTGRELAKLPLDPRIGRMILAAREEGALAEVLVIAAALSVQDPRERPAEQAGSADQAHAKWRDERSEFLAYLKLWQAFDALWQHQSQSKQRDWCRANFLSYLRMREWRDIHGQLHALCAEHGWRENQQPAGYDAIHRALLAGLLGNIGLKAEAEPHYLGARGMRFFPHPGSALAKKAGRWIVCAELVETSRLFGRCLAKIEPEWLERVGAHLIRRHVYDPHWEKNAGQVMAWERATLHGLTLYARRPVAYGRIDPKLARETFIREALVRGELPEEVARRAAFFQHNRRLVREIEALEHKSRRPDVLVDEDLVHAFYDALIPPEVIEIRGFEHWRKQAEQQLPRLLFLERDQLMRHEAAGITTDRFPASFELHGQKLKLTYRHEPGEADDGVSLTVPLAMLNQIPASRCEWLVPGLLEEKVRALVKTLPQKIRHRLAPADDFCAAFVDAGHDTDQPLLRALQRAVEEYVQLKLPIDAFRGENLPVHFAMNFRLVDEHGRLLGQSRNLAELRSRHARQVEERFAQAETETEALSGLTAWSFGELPELMEVKRGPQALVGYPALVDRGGAVDLELFDSAEKAASVHRVGLRRLFMLQLKEQAKYIEKSLPGMQAMVLQFASLGDANALKAQLVAAAFERACMAEPLPRDPAAFARRCDEARSRVALIAQELTRLVAAILAERQAVQKKLQAARAFGDAARDIEAQLARLLPKDFIVAVPWERLQHFPRYLKAASLRLDKLRADPTRDARAMTEIAPLEAQWLRQRASLAKRGASDAQLEQFGWLLEELRVSLFAQELKTPVPVSAKRLAKLWQSIRK